jgi:hypothetical protein
MSQNLVEADERRLRELALGLAKQIEDPRDLLTRLGFTSDDYRELCETRTFRDILRQASSEWEGAGNTHKRIKLKAAVNIEEALPSFYQAMVDPKEALSSRVKALEVIARIGGLGLPEPVAAGSGQFFRLEINLGKDNQGRALAPLTIDIDQSAQTSTEQITDQAAVESPATYSQSHLFDDLPLEAM